MTTALGIVLAVVFALLGIAKLASVPAMRGAAAHLGYTTDQYRAIGALETAGALGIVIGLKMAGIGVAAALGRVLLMLGAAWAHVKNHDAAARVVVPIAMAAIAAAYLFSLR
jgi:DoxX-like protein